MNVGVIGAGYWGRKHVEEYSALGHTVFVSDLSRENLTYCERNYGAQISKNHNDLLDNKQIECVSICTPNDTHHDMAILALNKGKNVLLEKPISTSISDADEIIQLAKKSKLVLLIGHIYRFNNAIEKIKHVVQRGDLGDIHTISLEWKNYEPIFHDRDILFDLGVHPIDIIDNIFEGEFNDAFCRTGNFRQKNAEFAFLGYKMNSQADHRSIPITIELSWINPIKSRKLTIVGSKKSAVVECVEQKITLIDNESRVKEELKIIPNNTLRDELDFFIKSSREKREILDPKPSGQVGKKVIEIIIKAKTSRHDSQ